MTLIKCENLSLAYDNKLVLNNVNFEITKGDYLCIVGDNGAGKSTLLKALLKLKTLKSGNIINNLKTQELGYLAQTTLIQKDFPASVKEVILSGTLSKQGFSFFYTKAQKKLADENMEKLGILEFKDKSIQELSGGQLQRVLLARALCASETILLLDEPTASLDPLISEEFYQLIKKLNDEGLTIVMVSHDIDSTLKYANKILHLKNEQLFFGTKDDYLKTELAKNFLRGKYVDTI